LRSFVPKLDGQCARAYQQEADSAAPFMAVSV
jgi:hypothetical protein